MGFNSGFKGLIEKPVPLIGVPTSDSVSTGLEGVLLCRYSKTISLIS